MFLRARLNACLLYSGNIVVLYSNAVYRILTDIYVIYVLIAYS